MKNTVQFSDFCDAFAIHDRASQFSFSGKRALFDYLEQYEDETDEEIELDVIALCCEYSEYESFEASRRDYDVKSIDELRDNTQVIEFTGGLIIQQY